MKLLLSSIIFGNRKAYEQVFGITSDELERRYQEFFSKRYAA
jgi:hypothetical protein